MSLNEATRLGIGELLLLDPQDGVLGGRGGNDGSHGQGPLGADGGNDPASYYHPYDDAEAR